VAKNNSKILILLSILLILSTVLIPRIRLIYLRSEAKLLAFSLLLILGFLNLLFFHTDKISESEIKNIDVSFFGLVLLSGFAMCLPNGMQVGFYRSFLVCQMFLAYIFFRIVLRILFQKEPNFYTNFILGFEIFISLTSAIIGLIYLYLGHNIKGIFWHPNYLACYLALNIPIILSLFLHICQKNKQKFLIKLILRILLLIIFCILLIALVFCMCRNTLLGALAGIIILLLPALKFLAFRNKKKAIIIGLCAVFLSLPIAYKLYEAKPLSVIGRTQIWAVAFKMFTENPVTGVGFGSFGKNYSKYQTNLFSSGFGTIQQRMSADYVSLAYNDFLQFASETGIIGIFIFGLFWFFVLKEVYKAFVTRKTQKRQNNIDTEYLTLGMCGAIICFAVISLFYFPTHILSAYLLFCFVLAWLVTANDKQDKCKNLMHRNNCIQ